MKKIYSYMSEKAKAHSDGFFNFLRQQGLIGLAVAFILGQAITRVIQALVNDIINPLLGIALGTTGNLADAKIKILGATVAWGDFVNTLIDFIVIALVVYIFVKILKADKLDKKKDVI